MREVHDDVAVPGGAEDAGPALDRDEAIARLVREAAAGDRAAWEGLVDRFGGLIWGIARGFRLSSSDCADVSQATWLRLLENINRLHDPARVGSWLATTARRECLRTVARRDKWLLAGDSEVLDVFAVEASVDDGLIREETVASVQRAVATLPARWRALIDMLMQDPMPSYDEIARALDVPIGSIGPTRGRTLQRLRPLLEA